jgi:hypothetical protein
MSAQRGNACKDAPRPAPQSGANIHSHAERGSEKKNPIFSKNRIFDGNGIGARRTLHKSITTWITFKKG